MIPEIPVEDVAWLSADQMREVDRVAIEEFGIALVKMMENAGRSLASLAVRRFHPRSVVVLAGPGGNGGGGLVAARHLANRGVEVSVSTSKEPSDPVPVGQLAAVRAMGIEVSVAPREADLVLDALIGYGLAGDPRGRAAELIRWADRGGGPILSLDVPSGLDATSGAVGSPCVEAAATMTLALPKRGLRTAPEVVGELYLADISIPPAVYRRLGWDAPSPFGEAWLVRVTTPAA